METSSALEPTTTPRSRGRSEVSRFRLGKPLRLPSSPRDSVGPCRYVVTMPYATYTHEVLAEAVASSTSMAEVLRNLGLQQNGGAHAHLRRRIDKLGIDTSHFLGRADYRGVPNPRRRRPSEILTVRPSDAKRAAPSTLRRALMELGRPYRCAGCGVGDTWNGHPLTLHVDHIDGSFWDCRPENLRFLCANCHSQTVTYAGRNRRTTFPVVRVDDTGRRTGDAYLAGCVTKEQRLDVLQRVSRQELTVTDAAKLIGCSRSHIYQLRRRLDQRGTLGCAERRLRTSATDIDAVIQHALRNPRLGPRRLAADLMKSEPPTEVAHGTIANILRRAGLSTVHARLEACGETDGRAGI
jgi:transposase-like protein